MSMKKILMAAAAVTALTAGSASAITISNATIVGKPGLTLAPQGGASGLNASDPYTLANEITTPANTSVVATIKSPLGAVLASGTQYLVTYSLTNGTFNSPESIATGDIKARKADGTTDVSLGSDTSLGTVNTTKAEFIIKPGAADAKQLDWETKGIKPLSTKLPVSMTVTIALLSSPTVAIDGGTSAAVTLIDFRDSVSFKVTASADPKLSIASGFKKFTVSGAADAASASIATAMGTSIAAATAAGGTTDVAYKDGAGNPIAGADVATAVLTIGGDLSKLDGRLGNAQLADTGTTNVFTANADNIALIRTTGAVFHLVGKATPLMGTEGAYTVSPVVTLGSGLTAPTFATAKLGSVVYEGTPLFVPWVSDGSNGTNNVIRIGNKSATVGVTSVKASLLNPTVAGT
jgi:hypothetical protein